MAYSGSLIDLVYTVAKSDDRKSFPSLKNILFSSNLKAVVELILIWLWSASTWEKSGLIASSNDKLLVSSVLILTPILLFIFS